VEVAASIVETCLCGVLTEVVGNRVCALLVGISSDMCEKNGIIVLWQLQLEGLR